LSQALAGLLSSRTTRSAGRTLVSAGVFAALVGVALAASPAPPRWLPVRDLSEPAADAVIPDIAVDAKGNATVVWAQAKDSTWTVQAVDHPAGGNWSGPVALSSPAGQVASPQVAIAGSNVVAVWNRYDGKNQITQAADRDPKTNAWSTPTSLSTSGRDAQAPRVAANSAGDAVAVWASVGLNRWTIQASYREHGGAWLATVPIEPPTVATAAPDVVIDPTGQATAVWAQTSGSGWRVYASSRGPDGTWSKAVAISGPDAAGTITPQLALEGNSDVTAVWSRFLGTNTVIEYSTRSAATGAWSPAAQLFPAGPDAVGPQIAVNKRGDGVLVWTGSDPSTGLSVRASLRSPGREWVKPVVLISAATGALAPQAAIDARGDALVVWTHFGGGFSRVQGSNHAAGSSSWTARRTLSKAGADAVTPQVALDPDGDGAVAWARVTGQSFVIQGEGYDGSGPELNKLSIPASGVVGKKLVFTVAPTDVWASVKAVRWSFGDGAAGTGRLTGHVYKRPGRYRASVTATDAFGHVRTVRRWIRILPG
jgi:PKD domain